MTKRALITGITGMDGSHMADLLLSKGYEVFGMVRHRSSGIDESNIAHILDRVVLTKGDLDDSSSLYRVVGSCQPDEIYNFAAQSFVGDSWNLAEHTANITGLGVLRLLDVVKTVNQEIRFVQASTSEMFGLLDYDVANERSRFHPRNPYGVAKLFAHHIVRNYRESYGMFASASIAFNHEGPRRRKQFVTRKITDGVARISLGLADTLTLGNLEPRRDWGYAPEYVEGVWRMLQTDVPDDFVFATGESHSVEEFVKTAFEVVGITGLQWKKYVTHDPKFMRPVEVDYLRGDYTKAKTTLGWEPSVKFKELVEIMVRNDIELLR